MQVPTRATNPTLTLPLTPTLTLTLTPTLTLTLAFEEVVESSTELNIAVRQLMREVR